MATLLHGKIAQVAATDPAFHVNKAVLIDLLTRSLRIGIDKYVGTYIPYPDGNGLVQIGIIQCDYSHSNAGWSASIPAGQTGVFEVESKNSFQVKFHVSKNGDKNVGLFSVTIDINSIKAIGSASSTKLSIDDVGFEFRTWIDADPNQDGNRISTGLSERQLARLEGLLEGSVALTVLKNIFSGAPTIDLKSLFPAISFNGQAELAEVDNGILVIAKNGWSLDPTQRCPCGATAPDIVTKPQKPVPRPDGGTIDVPVTIPKPVTRVVETTSEPHVSLYLPEPTVKGLTSGPYPAVTDNARDNGFIGWEYEYTIAFLNVSLSLTDPRATLVLAIDFNVSGAGKINVDVPCVGRQTAGLFWAYNRNAGPSRIEFGVTPVLRPDGKIVLESDLLKLEIKGFEVECVVIAFSLLGFFGPWGSVAAFVLNEIVRAVLKHNLPSMLKSSIKDAMGKASWTLINLAKFDLSRVFDQSFGVGATISRAPDSLLVGIQNNYGKGNKS